MSAKVRTERQALLERWTALESERCHPCSNYPDFVDFVLEGEWLTCKYAPDSALLGALIEAVTARDWDYAIESDSGRVTASVFDMNDEPVAHADSPTDALLGAYVQALEATQ